LAPSASASLDRLADLIAERGHRGQHLGIEPPRLAGEELDHASTLRALRIGKQNAARRPARRGRGATPPARRSESDQRSSWRASAEPT
jgi:hypothetical protein